MNDLPELEREQVAVSYPSGMHPARQSLPCLAVSKDTNIVPVNARLREVGDLFEDILLRRRRLEHMIESKRRHSIFDGPHG